MMEQTNSGKHHCHPISVAGIDNRIIPYRSAGLYDIFHTASAGAVDVVKEGEEGIGSQSYIFQFIQPLFSLFPCKNRSFTLKVLSQTPSTRTSI